MMGTEYTITVVGFNSVDGGPSVSEGAPSDVTEATNIDREFKGEGEGEGGGGRVGRGWGGFKMSLRIE